MGNKTYKLAYKIHTLKLNLLRLLNISDIFRKLLQCVRQTARNRIFHVRQIIVPIYFRVYNRIIFGQIALQEVLVYSMLSFFQQPPGVDPKQLYTGLTIFNLERYTEFKLRDL
jgi:hypothetical protein